MARTMTQGRPSSHDPLGWVTALTIAALVGAGAATLPAKTPAPSAAGEGAMIDQNLAP